MKKFSLRTFKKTQFIDITSSIKNIVKEIDLHDGICVVFCPHTTGAITINEAFDPDVQGDLAFSIDKISPDYPSFKHMEGNSDAHMKASLIGSSETIFVENGELKLGTWQGIYFAEFDGPRNREVWVKTL